MLKELLYLEPYFYALQSQPVASLFLGGKRKFAKKVLRAKSLENKSENKI